MAYYDRGQNRSHILFYCVDVDGGQGDYHVAVVPTCEMVIPHQLSCRKYIDTGVLTYLVSMSLFCIYHMKDGGDERGWTKDGR